MGNWAVMELWLYYCATSVRIIALTNNPCHLWCYHTENQPGRHRHSRTIRGLDTPWGAYFCFTRLTRVEQLEVGETTTHTFSIPNWLPCHTRFFAFKGLADGGFSKSVSPIFERHNPGGPEAITIIRPSAPGLTCTISNQVGAPCPNHYLNVDDETPDEDTTYVYQGGSVTQYKADLYEVSGVDPSVQVPIEKLIITVRLKRFGGFAYAASAYIVVMTHAWIYFSTEFSDLPENWVDRTWELTVNPFTLQPWTVPELNDLQLGLRLRHYSGVGWGTATACTQLYGSAYFTC